MRIERLRIDAFGQFQRFERELGLAMSLFYGPNEAGKSTLLSFIRSILFGFSRRSDPARYEPEHGAFGGELLLKTRSGALWARRVSSRHRYEGELHLRSAEGERLPPSRLSDALCAISRELFCQVFAFGLNELSSFEELAAQGTVSQALFAAGMQGAQRLPSAIASLNKASEALFVPRGSKPELNRRIAELSDVQGRISALGDRPRQYFEQRSQLDSLEQELRVQTAARRACERERDALQELNQLLSRLAEARGEQDRLEVENQGLALQLKSLEGPPLEEQDAARWRSALASFEARVEQWRSLEGRQRQLQDKERALLGQLSALGLSVSVSQLIEREPQTAKRALEALREEWAEASQRVAQAREWARGARELKAAQERQLERARSEFSSLPDLSEPELRQAQTALHWIEGLRAQAAALERTRLDRRAALEACGPETALPREAFPLSLALGASAMVLSLGAFAAWLSSTPIGTVVFAGALCVAALLLVVQRRSSGSFQAALTDACGRRAVQQERRARLSAELRALDGQSSELHQRIAAAAQDAGVAPDAQRQVLQARADLLLSQMNSVHTRERLCRELEVHKSALDLAAENERRREADLLAEQEQLAQCHLRQESLLLAQGLPTKLSPEGALQLWSELSALRQAFLDLRGQRLAWDAEAEACRVAATALQQAAASAHLCAQEPLGASAQLRAFLQRAAEAVREGRRVQDRLAQNAERASRLAERANELEGAVGAACQQAGLGSQGMLDVQLAAASASRLRATAERLSDLELRQRALLEQKGRIGKQLESWENDSELAQLRSREELLRAKIGDLAPEYAIRRLALGLLARARWRHEREQQPKVIRLASQLFRELTGGRYACVYTLADAPEALFVGDAQGKEWRAEQLSRGTREQLYLAFRLAVIQDFGETRQPLPVILDDILVNFDPERAQNAVKTLARVSKVHQVVAFSCHPSIRDLFQRHGAQILTLSQREVPLLESA